MSRALSPLSTLVLVSLFFATGCATEEPWQSGDSEKFVTRRQGFKNPGKYFTENRLLGTEVQCYFDGKDLFIRGIVVKVTEIDSSNTGKSIRITIQSMTPTSLNLSLIEIWHIQVVTWVNIEGKKWEEAVFTPSQYYELTCTTVHERYLEEFSQ